ncbi:acyl-CoA dehydrogenase family protein, partial [Leucobacter sp. M11]|uniref:acyl-CoA dehydrogenase family protein n=1 Tax=Leucobacter sp. M11 TaxID=2993565 RepID=UPI002D7F1D01
EPRALDDLLGIRELLSPAECAILAETRAAFDAEIRPLVAEHWRAGTFPSELPAILARLGVLGAPAAGRSSLLRGLLHAELARVDASCSTFLGVHGELCLSAVERYGSPEAQAALLPGLRELSLVGAFALTEPEHGSDISRAMGAAAVRDGDDWVLHGVKRWIGNGTIADVVLVWARDQADGSVLGFLVPGDAAGLSRTLIEDKISLRIVQNADLVLDGVRVPESRRLPGVRGFGDVAELLTASRVWVAWQTLGLQLAAYDHALRYARERSQFGQPIGGFQLVQQKLVRILENVTASLAVLAQLARLQDEGRVRSEQAALAKASGSARMRESVALARELFGGNGIVQESGIARVFADAEALYTYEGSHDINTLLVGRAITGISAF